MEFSMIHKKKSFHKRNEKSLYNNNFNKLKTRNYEENNKKENY